MENEHPTREAEPAARGLAARGGGFSADLRSPFLAPEPAKGRAQRPEWGLQATQPGRHRSARRGIRAEKGHRTLLSLLFQCIPGKLNHRERSLDRYTDLNAL